MIKNQILMAAAILLLIACQPKGVVVKGQLVNGEDESVVLERLSSTDIIAKDSTIIGSDGKFKLTDPDISDPAFYRLRVGENNYIILLLDKGEKVEVRGNALDLYKSYEVSGSPGSEKLRALDQRLRQDYELADSLRRTFMQLQAQGIYDMDSVKNNIDSVFLASQEVKDAFIKQFIEENSGSLAALSAVQSLNYDAHADLYDKVAADLEKAYPNSDYVKQFKKQLADLKTKQQASARLSEGSPAPEIVLQTPDGETIRLSDFRGKVTLIDFWASWCKPCRAENPNVVRLYKKYKDKGFEIFGVSLDRDKDSWVTAIKQDGLVWKHGSELKFWQSSFVPTYNLDGIPMTYLVDQNGTIIAKGLRGQQLEQKLEEILNPS